MEGRDPTIEEWLQSYERQKGKTAPARIRRLIQKAGELRDEAGRIEAMAWREMNRWNDETR